MDKSKFLRISVLVGFLTFTACTGEQQPDGTSAALNIEMDNSAGDATLFTGAKPTIFNLSAQQTEIMSNFGASPPSKERIQIPADQTVAFTDIETFGALPLKCELDFSFHAHPNQEYLLVVGDIPPAPKAANAIAEIGHVLSSGDVPRCYVRRFQKMADGTLKPFPFNDVTFEPSVVH